MPSILGADLLVLFALLPVASFSTSGRSLAINDIEIPPLATESNFSGEIIWGESKFVAKFSEELRHASLMVFDYV